MMFKIKSLKLLCEGALFVISAGSAAANPVKLACSQDTENPQVPLS